MLTAALAITVVGTVVTALAAIVAFGVLSHG
jgi:hypothetical protein